MLPRITPFYFEDSPAESEQYVTIQCTVSQGDLPLKISWMFNNVSIQDDGRILVTAVGKRSSSLSIESVDYTNVGNYTCRAQNKAGYTDHTAFLAVNGSLYYQFLRMKL